MVLSKIFIDNFQIFYGKQHLELTNGLYVIHGENGRGKSTFLNAVTWALFGEYLNRQGEPVTPIVMLNLEAAREGTTNFSVELQLKDEGDKIRVKRSFDTADPEAGVRLAVEKNGNMLNQEDGEELLRGLLDRDVSRFFLFDGEELRRYEELLFGQSGTAAEVRRSIEHILGLPALTNAVNDLNAVADGFASAATKAARKEKGAEQAAKLAGQLEKDIKDAESDLAELTSKRAELEAEVKDATAILQEHQASNGLINKKVEVEAEIRSLRDSRKTMVAMRAESLRDVWKDVLAVAVKPRRDALAADLEDEQQREIWKREADEIDAALANARCDRCEQPLHGDAEKTLRDRLATLRTKPQPSGSPGEAGAALGVLAAIAPTGQTTQAINQDKSISKDDAKLAGLEQRLGELTKETEGVPEEKLREAAKQRDNALRLIGVTDDRIEAKNKAIDKIKGELSHARKEAQKHSSSKETTLLTKREELATDLAAIFEEAKDQFRDAMRDKVGGDASELFAKLTSDKDLKGLAINENYGLTTLGPDGEPMPSRSAGQEQIVAFSLIGALNRNATRRAPIIMDTPLGRLGKQHKANVLANLADFGEQVLLLVHDDEVSDDLLNSVRSSIVAEYELHRDDLFRTQIQKREMT
jgi:DNA sulfur modification protein DndD